MPVHPDVERVQKLLRRQQMAVRVAVGGFVLIGVGLAIGFGAGLSTAAIAVGVAGIVVAILSLVVSIVFAPLVGIAMRKVTPDLAAASVVTPGERFGRMTVVTADGDTLHLSLGESPMTAGLARLVACVGSLAFAAGLFAVAFSSKYPFKAGLTGLAALIFAVAIAAMPFAMQWIIGDVVNGERGIAIERVRWFFKHDTLYVPADRVAKLVLTDLYLTVSTADGSSVLLARTPTSVLGVWEKRRLIAEIQRTLGREIPVVEHLKG